MDTFVQAHFLITRTQKQCLRDLSARDDRAMAVFVRDALDYYLRIVAGPPAQMLRGRLLAAVGTLPLAEVDDATDDGRQDGTPDEPARDEQAEPPSADYEGY